MHPPIPSNLKIWVHIVGIKALDPVDVSDAADFWLTIQCRVLSGTVYDSTYTSAKPIANNNNDVTPKYIIPSFDVPNDASYIAITITLYDKDLTGSDACDISRLTGRSAAVMYYTVSTDSWDGYAYRYTGDPNGIGQVSGEEDGYGGDEDDCEIWFWITRAYYSPSGISGYVKNTSGGAISSATVKIYAWRWDNHLQREGWVYYASVTTDSTGYFFWSFSYMGKVTLHATKSGYWEQRINSTTGASGVTFQLDTDKTVWKGTEFAMYASVNTAQISVTYDWTKTYDLGVTVYSWAAGTGGEYSWTSTVGVSGTQPGNYKSFVERRVVVVHGTYWDVPGKIFGAWATSSYNSYAQDLTRTDPVSLATARTWPQMFKIYEDTTLYPDETPRGFVKNGAKLLVGVGAEVSLGVDLSAIVVGVSASFTLRVGVNVYAANALEMGITVKNIDPQRLTHGVAWYVEPLIRLDGTYDLSVLSLILHAYQTS